MKGEKVMKKKLILNVVLALILVISLTSCAGTKETSQNNSSDLESDKNMEELTVNEPTGQPIYGGEVVVAVTNEIDSIDPYLAVAAGTREILFNVFEGLVKFNPNGEVIPAVAQTFEVSEDFKRYTFKIRDGLKFHNGNNLTIKDVKYSIEKAISTSTSPAFSNIDDVVTDGSTVILNLKESDNDLLPFLTANFCSIIPAGYEDSGTTPIGTGPFKFVSYDIQQSFVVEKFKDYWDADNVYLDKVTFKLFSDQNSAYLELLSGTIDVFPSIEIEHYDQLKDDFNITLGYKNIVQVLAFNSDVEPFTNIKVRQAINYAVNKDEIIDVQSNGYATKLGSAILPGFKKYFDESLAEIYEVDIEKAKSLLALAGHENGFEFTIKVPSNYEFHVRTAELIAAQLEKIGVIAKIEQVEWATWLEDVYARRNHEATIIGLTGELSPRDWLSRYVSTSNNNFFNFSSEKYDKAYNDALKEMDEEARVQKYLHIQRILAEEAAAVFIQDTQFLNVLKPNLYGYTSYPLYVLDMSRIYYVE